MITFFTGFFIDFHSPYQLFLFYFNELASGYYNGKGETYKIQLIIKNANPLLEAWPYKYLIKNYSNTLSF